MPRESKRIKWIPNRRASYLLPEGNKHSIYLNGLEYQNDYIMSQEVIEICLTYYMDKPLQVRQFKELDYANLNRKPPQDSYIRLTEHS